MHQQMTFWPGIVADMHRDGQQFRTVRIAVGGRFVWRTGPVVKRRRKA